MVIKEGSRRDIPWIAVLDLGLLFFYLLIGWWKKDYRQIGLQMKIGNECCIKFWTDT